MLASFKRLSCFLLILALSGCGFHPMYATRGNNAPLRTELARIQVDTIKDRSGQILRNQLVQELGFGDSPANPDYRLSIELLESVSYLGIRQDASSSYGRLTIEAKYTLTDASTGKPVLTDGARAFSGFSIVDSEYASLAGERDARQKTLHQLGDLLAERVAVFLARKEP